MHVIIYNENTLDLMYLLGIARGNGDITEQAEAHRAVWHGVMPRRANCRQPVIGFARDDSAHGIHNAACRKQRDFVGSGCYVGIGIESDEAIIGRRLLEEFEISRSMQ